MYPCTDALQGAALAHARGPLRISRRGGAARAAIAGSPRGTQRAVLQHPETRRAQVCSAAAREVSSGPLAVSGGAIC